MSYRRGSTIRKDVSDQRKERTHAKDPRTKTLDSLNFSPCKGSHWDLSGRQVHIPKMGSLGRLGDFK